MDNERENNQEVAQWHRENAILPESLVENPEAGIGVVKMIHDKGFAFITSGGKDYFVPPQTVDRAKSSAKIHSVEFSQGSKVLFEKRQGRKGPMTENVFPMFPEQVKVAEGLLAETRKWFAEGIVKPEPSPTEDEESYCQRLEQIANERASELKKNEAWLKSQFEDPNRNKGVEHTFLLKAKMVTLRANKKMYYADTPVGEDRVLLKEELGEVTMEWKVPVPQKQRNQHLLNQHILTVRSWSMVPPSRVVVMAEFDRTAITDLGVKEEIYPEGSDLWKKQRQEESTINANRGILEAYFNKGNYDEND